MPRYFFHVMDGRASLDREGVELAGLDEVRAEAIRTAGEILRETSGSLWSGCPWNMTVADAAGDTVFTLRFTAYEYKR